MWRLAGTLAFALSVLVALAVLAPASLVSSAIERASDGRLTLAAARGTLWSGSGTLVARVSGARAGIAWAVSPAALLRGRLAGTATIGAESPFRFAAGWRDLRLEGVAIMLPAALVAEALGPFGRYRIGGSLRARTAELVVRPHGLHGQLQLAWQDATTGLIPIAPLGSYLVDVTASTHGAALSLRTLAGPLRLDGASERAGSHSVIALRAQAEGAQAETLNDWLSALAAQRTTDGFLFHVPLQGVPWMSTDVARRSP